MTVSGDLMWLPEQVLNGHLSGDVSKLSSVIKCPRQVKGDVAPGFGGLKPNTRQSLLPSLWLEL